MKLIDITTSEDETISEDLDLLPAIGIDLGTTNSLVAYSENQKPHIIPDQFKQKQVPSIISNHAEPKIGNEVRNKGRNVIRSSKRLLGKNLTDLTEHDLINNLNIDQSNQDNDIYLKLSDDKKITAVEISAKILQQLRDNAEKHLNSVVNQAVITVPAYFDDAARNATKQAAKLAGIEVLRLLNEPTAAALAYGLDEKMRGNFLIYDLGGGTFDVSILEMSKGIFRVLATGGDTNLGGDDIDFRLAEFIAKKFIEKNDIEVTAEIENDLLSFAKQVKETCSSGTDYIGEFSHSDWKVTVAISHNELSDIITPLLTKTINILSSVLKDSKLKKENIDEVILVGGSTRIKLLKDMISNFFNKKPLASINPDEVVALGAAIQAEALTRGTDNLLVDVVPLSLGIETMGGLVEKIIERNSAVPAYASQEFTTYENNQTGLVIHVLQGERELVSQNRSLGKFILNDLPHAPAGKLKIKIEFKVDRDGILTITASETTHNLKQEILIKPSFGLDEHKVIELLRESMTNAKSDMKDRLIAKSKFEIKEKAKAIMELLNKDFDFFSDKEIKNAKEFANHCNSFIESEHDLSELQEFSSKAKEYLDNLALAKVEKITSALKGKKVSEIEDILNNN